MIGKLDSFLQMGYQRCIDNKTADLLIHNLAADYTLPIR